MELLTYEAQAEQKYRPVFHFSPPNGWMNDPNGLLYHDGIYHLYYQHNPHSLDWGPMHWGHAISTDLIRWEHLPIAFEPEGEKTDYYSGCAVFDSSNTSGFFKEGSGIVAIYTHRTDGVQEQAVSWSNDGGRTFTPYQKNPVIPNPGCPDFRDPKVFWMEETSSWHMVLVKKNCVEFYRSSNLRNWEKTGSFGHAHGLHRGSWECPDLFPLQAAETNARKWILIVGDFALSRTQYFVGEFDGQTFHCDSNCEQGNLLDYGYDNYSGNTYNGTVDGRRVFISWLNSTLLWNCVPTSPWRGIYTFPRLLSLKKYDDGYHLLQMPIPELSNRLVETKHVCETLPYGLSPLPLQGQALCLDASLQNKDASRVQFLLAASGAEHLEVGIDFRLGHVYVDRSHTGNCSFAADKQFYPLFADCPARIDNGKIFLRILLDRCSVEVFVNNGEQCLTSLYFTSQCGQLAYVCTDGEVFGDISISTVGP